MSNNGLMLSHFYSCVAVGPDRKPMPPNFYAELKAYGKKQKAAADDGGIDEPLLERA